jgi:protein PhnA
MAIDTVLQNRSNNQCELCSNKEQELIAYTIPPAQDSGPDHQVVLCTDCHRQISTGNYEDANHWRCLTGSIWSETPAVQVLSYKILGRLLTEDWAREAMDGAYLDESLLEWAGAEDALKAAEIVHKDAYGVVLEAGDTVILTQNLNVKGANFIAPKGTIVRKIRLVADNAEQIEGKIEGDTIVILTKYVRKQS